MSLTTRALPALYNGISRQPAILRSPDQNEDELNTYAVLAEGVSKRPPTQHIVKLADSLPTTAFIHTINRDTSERYVVAVDNGFLRVWDWATGAEKTVSTPHGLGYLSAPGGSYRAVTVADYTFIVNTEKTCALLAAGSDHVAQPTDYIWLSNRLLKGLFESARGAPFQYGANPTSLGIVGSVQSVEKLPEAAPDGAIYEVTGQVGLGGYSTFYVIRNGAVWDETVKPNLNNAINADTMPHALIRQADGTFLFAPFSWAPRRVGNDDTNPPPSFIGRCIRDVYFYQNRLHFLSDESNISSCAGDFGNFWRSTTLDALDSDVVDISASLTKVSILNYAVPFRDGVMLFADQTQFGLSNGEAGFSTASASIVPVTEYAVNTGVRPVLAGSEVYFAANRGAFTAIYEYTRNTETDVTTAADVTAHVSDLIPRDAVRLITGNESNALFVLTGGKDVFCYQFYWSANEKVQSSWKRWEFGGDVIGGEYLDGRLDLVIRRANGVYLERVDLRTNEIPSGALHRIFLDRLGSCTASYNASLNKTIITLPYQSSVAERAKVQVIRGADHPTRPGSLVDPSTYFWGSPTTVEVPGNETGSALLAGERYAWRLEFSTQFVVDGRGTPITTGRLQLRTFTVNFTDTGFFQAEVRPYGNQLPPEQVDIIPSKLADFTGKVIGVGSLQLNRPVLHTGTYSFQVYGEAKQARIC